MWRVGKRGYVFYETTGEGVPNGSERVAARGKDLGKMRDASRAALPRKGKAACLRAVSRQVSWS